MLEKWHPSKKRKMFVWSSHIWVLFGVLYQVFVSLATTASSTLCSGSGMEPSWQIASVLCNSVYTHQLLLQNIKWQRKQGDKWPCRLSIPQLCISWNEMSIGNILLQNPITCGTQILVIISNLNLNKLLHIIYLKDTRINNNPDVSYFVDTMNS